MISTLPMISIITVVYNDKDNIERTIKSVLSQTYKNFEYIVVDGKSVDGTMSIIEQYQDSITKVVSEKDLGIYFAMNTGVKIACGELLLFMNCGDVFSKDNILENVIEYLKDKEYDVLYSDTYEKDTLILLKADMHKLKFIHQSILYKKSLHKKYGLYLTSKGITISDYVFFVTCFQYNEIFIRYKEPIAIYDTKGVSAGLQTYLQRVCFNMSVGIESRIKGTFKIVIHPIYNWFKKKWKIIWKK